MAYMECLGLGFEALPSHVPHAARWDSFDSTTICAAGEKENQADEKRKRETTPPGCRTGKRGAMPHRLVGSLKTTPRLVKSVNSTVQSYTAISMLFIVISCPSDSHRELTECLAKMVGFTLRSVLAPGGGRGSEGPRSPIVIGLPALHLRRRQLSQDPGKKERHMKYNNIKHNINKNIQCKKENNNNNNNMSAVQQLSPPGQDL